MGGDDEAGSEQWPGSILRSAPSLGIAIESHDVPRRSRMMVEGPDRRRLGAPGRACRWRPGRSGHPQPQVERVHDDYLALGYCANLSHNQNIFKF